MDSVPRSRLLGILRDTVSKTSDDWNLRIRAEETLSLAQLEIGEFKALVQVSMTKF